MNNSEFYNTITLIDNHKNTVALINIDEFKRLQRINGEYKWIPLEIGSMPAIPIVTTGFKEQFRSTKEQVSIRIIPIWTFLPNDEQVITPNIEMFEITEHSNSNPRYTLKRKISKNHHYLSNSNWNTVFDKPLAKRQNAIEWQKSNTSTLLAPINENILQTYLNIYKEELDEFNKIYEQSAKTTKELNGYQKKLK